MTGRRDRYDSLSNLLELKDWLPTGNRANSDVRVET